METQILNFSPLAAARLCALSYDNGPQTPDEDLEMIVGGTVRYYRRVSARDLSADIVATDEVVTVAFRGTEFSNVKSARRNLNADLEPFGPGQVHEGYARGFRQLEPKLLTALEAATFGFGRPLMFTGHSQGGALATVAALYGIAGDIDDNDRAAAFKPYQVITFAAPAAGNVTVGALMPHGDRFQRYTSTNDVIPRLPPSWLGYEHATDERYLNRNCEIVVNPWRLYRLADGFLNRVATRTFFDSMQGHRIATYIEKLERGLK